MTEALRLIELIDTLILGGAAGEDITLSHKEALAIRAALKARESVSIEEIEAAIADANDHPPTEE